uniref:Uncharacterized protein n=1 Tax=Rhizophora mucronata TaxID=61149 RepID=A0A2P2LC65_RHIMU
MDIKNKQITSNEIKRVQTNRCMYRTRTHTHTHKHILAISCTLCPKI